MAGIRIDLPVHKINDASAACLAEMSLHHRTHQLNCIYYYVGTFFGGGIALGGHIFEGNSGQAASVASLPLSLPKDGKSPSQMVSAAGLHTLEAEAIARGFDRNIFLQNSPFKMCIWHCLTAGLKKRLCAGFCGDWWSCYLDAPVSIIDGRLPEMLMSRLVEKVKLLLRNLIFVALPCHSSAGQAGDECPSAWCRDCATASLFFTFHFPASNQNRE